MRWISSKVHTPLQLGKEWNTHILIITEFHQRNNILGVSLGSNTPGLDWCDRNPSHVYLTFHRSQMSKGLFTAERTMGRSAPNMFEVTWKIFRPSTDKCLVFVSASRQSYPQGRPAPTWGSNSFTSFDRIRYLSLHSQRSEKLGPKHAPAIPDVDSLFAINRQLMCNYATIPFTFPLSIQHDRVWYPALID